MCCLLLELQQHGYNITANNTPAVTPTVKQSLVHIGVTLSRVVGVIY